jgi:tRNA threonylcarbamoyladenosine biosynthesis protein TsaB
MKLLAIETATEACSAALLIEGSILNRFELAPRRHAELILLMCESLLAEAGLALAQLDAIAFGRGPGSFTGVRIAAGVAQGLAYALDLPVVPVSTLAALAQEMMTQADRSRVLAALDARMNEIYWACYLRDESGYARLAGTEQVGRPALISLPATSGWTGVGSGWAAYGDVLAQRLGSALQGYEGERLPQARYVAQLGEVAYRAGLTVPAEQAQPVYLRDEVAQKRR